MENGVPAAVPGQVPNRPPGPTAGPAHRPVGPATSMAFPMQFAAAGAIPSLNPAASSYAPGGYGFPYAYAAPQMVCIGFLYHE